MLGILTSHDERLPTRERYRLAGIDGEWCALWRGRLVRQHGAIDRTCDSKQIVFPDLLAGAREVRDDGVFASHRADWEELKMR